jgi:hypothetical protein
VKLTARKTADVEYIQALPTLGDVGLVIVDDFHKLPDGTKEQLADYLKTLADSSNAGTKIVVIGIRKAGESLISFASDLMNRIDVITFENNPEFKVRELIEKGEQALNTKINVADEIVSAAHGSFYIAQLLCHEACILSNALSAATSRRPLRSASRPRDPMCGTGSVVSCMSLAGSFARAPR